MLAIMAKRMGASAAAQSATPAARSLHIFLRGNGEEVLERQGSRLHGIMNEDGVFKSLALKRHHEKGSQRRKRKVEEQTIRHANRRIGSVIDFILRRRKSGF